MIVKKLQEHHVPNKRLGRHVEHDPRSREFAFGVSVYPLHTVHHRVYGGILSQGALGSCTGNAAAAAKNTRPLHKSGDRLLTEADAVELYQKATQLDGIPGIYPPDDTGSSGLAVAKALKQKGLIVAYRHAFSVEEALSALQVGPVITGVNWYEGFDDPDSHGLVKLSGQVRGGHEFVVVGFDHHENLDDSIVVAHNSWGANWGRFGTFRFSVRTWRTLLDEQGDVTILI